MRLLKAEEKQVSKIVDMSIRAFETDVNIGLTKSPKRGHHKNVKIHNPQDWNQDSYLRDDVRIDSKEYLSEVLRDYKLCPEDIDKIWAIIKKKDSH